MLIFNSCQLGQKYKTWQNTDLERLEEILSFLSVGGTAENFTNEKYGFLWEQASKLQSLRGDKKTKQIISKILQMLDNLPLPSQSTEFTKIFWTWFKEQIYFPLYTERNEKQIVLNKHGIQPQKSRKLLSNKYFYVGSRLIMKSKGEMR